MESYIHHFVANDYTICFVQSGLQRSLFKEDVFGNISEA